MSISSRCSWSVVVRARVHAEGAAEDGWTVV